MAGERGGAGRESAPARGSRSWMLFQVRPGTLKLMCSMPANHWIGPAGAVGFYPKYQASLEESCSVFGCSESEFLRWIPEVCGILCLKMVLDTYGLALDRSPYDLTMRCFNLGGFIRQPDGSLRGVFHRPLLQLARELGLQGFVATDYDLEQVDGSLGCGRFVILSIDLHRLDSNLLGSHLILVHGMDLRSSRYRVHDSAAVLNDTGCNAVLVSEQLALLSNRKGLVLWRSS